MIQQFDKLSHGVPSRRNKSGSVMEIRFVFEGEPDFGVVMYYPYGYLPQRFDTVRFGGHRWLIAEIEHDFDYDRIVATLAKHKNPLDEL